MKHFLVNDNMVRVQYVSGEYAMGREMMDRVMS